MRKSTIFAVVPAALALMLLGLADSDALARSRKEARAVAKCSNNLIACGEKCAKDPDRLSSSICQGLCDAVYNRCMDKAEALAFDPGSPPPRNPKAGNRVPPRGQVADDPKQPQRGPAGARVPLGATSR